MSDAKQLKKLYMNKPAIIDVEANQSEKSTMPSVKEQIDTL